MFAFEMELSSCRSSCHFKLKNVKYVMKNVIKYVIKYVIRLQNPSQVI